ncbi:Centaurin-gamma-1A, partial [Fasciola gigantica]
PQENHDFIIVTADNTQWHFEAPSTAIRDEWIQQIDAVIHHRLRSGVVSVVRNNSTSVYPSDTVTSAVFTDRIIPPQTGRLGNRPLSTGAAGSGTTDGLFKLGGGEDVCGQEEVLQRLSALAGNDCCADCGAPNPEWASLNLVVLICIECSGVHRELGTHISRVRSATLDTWTREHLAVMASFGNTLANSVWEASAPSKAKQFKYVCVMFWSLSS